MQIRVAVDAVSGAGWALRLIDPATRQDFAAPGGGAPLLPEPRRLACCRQGAMLFPLPPAGEANALGSGVAGADLCRQTDQGSALLDALASLRSQQAGARGVVRFGNYLWRTLFGAALWQSIRDAAGGAELELALELADDDAALHALPWETMHDGAQFLAQLPRVALTRRVAGAAQTLAAFGAPPRVLFALGTEPGDDVIRPGAEYLGLLRTLRDAGFGMGLRSHLLCSASTETLEAAVRRIRPDVVHFICHGEVIDGEGKLELADSQNPAARAWVGATQLLQLLSAGATQPLPQVVVLNSCSSAGVALVDAGTPLAVRLVRGGIAVVAGMSGPVADQACRLFSRGFYLTLLRGGAFAHAAADGRRAALRHGGVDPDASADWALPVLFLAEGAGEVALGAGPAAQLRERENLAAAFGPPEDPVFCDRFSLLQRFDLLLADEDDQRRSAQRAVDLQFLAVSAEQPDAVIGSEPQLGRTWLLREFAAHAAREGHLPCLVLEEVLEGAAGRPKTLAELVPRILDDAAMETARCLGIAWDCSQTRCLLAHPAGQPLPVGADPELQRNYRGDPLAPRLLAIAMRIDLLALLAAVQAQRGSAAEPSTRIVLFVDNLHRLDKDVVEGLLKDLIGGSWGFRGAKAQLRFVFTWSTKPVPGQELSVKAISDWLGQCKWAEPVSLERFRAGGEEQLAYKQYLLHWRDKGTLQPLTLAVPDHDQFAQWFFRRMSSAVQGYPSGLKTMGPGIVVSALDLPARLLRRADDDDALRSLTPAGGGP